MEILGYVAALFIGLSLGLTGSGGAILTVPILVYLMHLHPVMAMAYSLFVVGVTSLVGSFKFYQKNLVSFQTAFTFGPPSMLTVFLTRKFIVPAIPAHLGSLGGFEISKGLLLMVLFAAMMIAAAYSMIRRKKYQVPAGPAPDLVPNVPALLFQGVSVGLVSGMVGAGGGFLIIPALVLFSKLDMRMAVGTSLLIIAANSLFGFIGDVFNYDIHWQFLLTFSSLSVLGIFIGTSLSHRIHSDKLKTGFGWFVLFMGLYVILKELFL